MAGERKVPKHIKGYLPTRRTYAMEHEIGGHMTETKQPVYREARHAANIRAEAAASEMGVSITTLLNWERGVTKPNAENIRDMARLYKVSSDYLLGLPV